MDRPDCLSDHPPVDLSPPTSTFIRDTHDAENMATPLHRHQASLESVIDPLAMPPLSPSERTRAVSIFLAIIEHCNSYEISYKLHPDRRYKRGTLLKLVYDHAISELGRDNILTLPYLVGPCLCRCLHHSNTISNNRLDVLQGGATWEDQCCG